ncbi:hypothetical protein QJ854_gp098 [Moumouvirus goulette]|uniref:Nudix hydrolase domain-containing protein n=1 Tax=Moumouvirus goulette TaxID=1247379 RepID=M1PCH6_9VIRU|nr:hypothetical protein QJ854_gp098 [Moumouvirus goulette]AGF85684.1 hypothetical protein glt_00881 [Moumouvirus goulette]
MSSLVEVNTFENTKIQNVVLYLFVQSGNYILTVTERSGRVGFPSGRVEKGDHNIFKSIKREFKEETGHEMPIIENIRRFIYKESTAIYVAKTSNKIPTRLGPKSDGEIISIRLTKISDIKKSLNGKANFTLRSCAHKSTLELFNILGQ